MNAQQPRRRAWLVMPGYDGSATANAARAFWRASAQERAKIPIDVDRTNGNGSLLAQNFNAQWCMAMNATLQGKRVDYFAMLHADVEPDDGWLDVLIEELEEHNLDVLSAVVPIKDHKGTTSTALARDDGDNWRPLCRLTMREIYDLPETFTAADVGHPLLLNTGCWVCRFDMAWASKVHFTIHDRIVFNTKSNMYQAQSEPEDWYFSRLCNELKLKLGATRRVQLDHAGRSHFTNRQPWGQDHFDMQYVPESLVAPPNPPGWVFPEDVEGWLLPSEGRALAELARGKHVLEIGSFCGRSTICIAQTATLVISIDPHDGRATPKPFPTQRRMKRNLESYGVGNVQMLKGEFSDFEPSYLGLFDLVFIDGNHSLESVQSDIQQALKCLKPGGLLAFHDYRKRPGQYDGRWDAGVTQAVDELINEGGGELLAQYATVAVVKPPLPILENSHA